MANFEWEDGAEPTLCGFNPVPYCEGINPGSETITIPGPGYSTPWQHPSFSGSCTIPYDGWLVYSIAIKSMGTSVLISQNTEVEGPPEVPDNTGASEIQGYSSKLNGVQCFASNDDWVNCLIYNELGGWYWNDTYQEWWLQYKEYNVVYRTVSFDNAWGGVMPPCPVDTTYDNETGVCKANCGDVATEVLKNTVFTTLTDPLTAEEWESSGVTYNQTSQSDFTTTDNIAHFGDGVCEYISQPLTTDNIDYRYNSTVTYKVGISYIDIRNATPDSTITIDIGGTLDVYDLSRIQNELPLVDGVYSFQTGEEAETLEYPVPAVAPGTLATAKLWQTGNIILEVVEFGLLGYRPCDGELYDIAAFDSGFVCGSPEEDITKYLWQQDLYRRKIVTFDTDVQGLVPQYLDKILVSHSALQWGEAGEVVSITDAYINLSDKLVDLTSGKTIVFRNIDGSISGAYGVGIIDEYNIEVVGKPAWVQPKTLYTIQDMSTAQEFLVTSVVPNGNVVTVECVEYVEEIYK